MYELHLEGTYELPAGQLSVTGDTWDLFCIDKTSENLQELEKIFFMEKLKGSVHDGYIRPVTCNDDCSGCVKCDIEPIHYIEPIYMQTETGKY